MPDEGFKANLHHYLQQARETVLWKLAGLSEYDVRRPLTPTGTNLLGLVKHLAAVDAPRQQQPARGRRVDVDAVPRPPRADRPPGGSVDLTGSARARATASRSADCPGTTRCSRPLASMSHCRRATPRGRRPRGRDRAGAAA